MKGIDVCSKNGEINWDSVKSAGIDCVYIRASKGEDFVDPNLEEYYKGAGKKGLLVGFYHYLTGLSQPEHQAEKFYEMIKNKRNDMCPCLYLEYSWQDPEFYMEYVLRFIERFKMLSRMTISIYASPRFVDKELYSWLKRYPLWSAETGVDEPSSNLVWGNNYAGHQYSKDGRVSGICGKVNMNRFNYEILI